MTTRERISNSPDVAYLAPLDSLLEIYYPPLREGPRRGGHQAQISPAASRFARFEPPCRRKRGITDNRLEEKG